jgi:hypothetical protein
LGVGREEGRATPNASALTPNDEEEIVMMLRSVSTWAAIPVMLLSFGFTQAQPAPGEEVTKEGFRVELKKAAPVETARARLVETLVDLKALEADLLRKQQELEQARARLEKARAAASRTAAVAVAQKGVTIRIEISGLEGKPEELRALVARLEKELPGKDHKVLILAGPQADAWRITNQLVRPGAPVEASGWKIVKPAAPGTPVDPRTLQRGPIVVQIDKEGAKAVPGDKVVRNPVVVRWTKEDTKPPAKEEARTEALEKKLDGLLKELAELRRELAGLRAREAPQPQRK